MVAAATPLPVVGVPVPLKVLDGLDSLLSIVQMPAGVPVATVAVGGARNAGLLAVRILAAADEGLRALMQAFQESLQADGVEKDAALRRGRRSDRQASEAASRAPGCGWHARSGTVPVAREFTWRGPRRRT
jgi:5-(carboxyamino)imidazole ribonucleotide mutase